MSLLAVLHHITRVDWKVQGLTKILTWNVPLAVHTLLPSVLLYLDFIDQKSHQQQIWCHHMNFSARPHRPAGSLHTSSIGVAVLGFHWSKSHQQQIWCHHMNFSACPHRPACSSHTSSIGVAVLRFHWSKKSSTADMNFSAHPHRPPCSLHTSSIGVAVLGFHWSKKSSTADMNFSAHPCTFDCYSKVKNEVLLLLKFRIINHI